MIFKYCIFNCEKIKIIEKGNINWYCSDIVVLIMKYVIVEVGIF